MPDAHRSVDELIGKLLDGTATAGEGLDLALIAQLLGDKQAGLAIQHEVLRSHQLFGTYCHASEPRLKILALAAETDLGSNTPIEFLLEGSAVALTTLYLLPGVEPEKPGDKLVILDQPSGRWGLQICKDMDFPKLSRECAAEGANLMLVPAWDFNVDRWLHSRMAVLRAVENGFALARSARNGLLTLNDNRGRILAETATAPGRFASISGILSVAPKETFYAQTGDWFAWLCVAVCVVLFAVQLLIRLRPE